MSKTLIKLVDESIIPSLSLVLAKVGGLFLAIFLFSLEYEFTQNQNEKIIPFGLVFENNENLLIANSFSNILMLIVPLIGFNIVIYKINNFQNKRLTPKKIIKIADKDRLSSIETSESIYTKAVVWTIFLWIAITLTVINSINLQSYSWTAIIAVILGIICSLILVKNVEIDYTDKK